MIQTTPNFESQTVLVTGGTGFVGKHLLRALAGHGASDLHAASLAETEKGRGVSPDGIGHHQLDLTDRQATRELIDNIRPALVFHLAAQSHVPTSFREPEKTWRVNLNGTLNILDSLARRCPGATFINIGSADVYGASFRDNALVSESTPLAPLNPYAASKAAADLAAFQFSATTGLRIIRARPFNHSGPGQSEAFVLPALVAQVVRIEAGLQEPVLRTGDLSPRRNFLHVRDVISAYLTLAQQADSLPGGSVFNIASGESMAIAELLDRILEKSRCEIAVTTDPAKLRPVDIANVCGDATALQKATGWRRQYSIDNLIDDLLDHWRGKIKSGTV